MPLVSERGQNAPLSPFRKLAPLAEKAKAAGKKVYHLNIGQPDIPTPPSALEAVRNSDKTILEYSPAEGYLSYRQKLTAYFRKFQVETHPDDIIVTTGASEALLLAFLACLNPGDEVIAPEPFYANYNGFALMAGIHIRPITCNIEDGFDLPPVEAIEAAVGPRTRGVLITNPNNPTGSFYSKASLEALADVVKRHDLFLFADEVYREFCFDGQEFYSVLRLQSIRDHVLVVDSISKRFSACGARVGAIIAFNPAILEAINRFAKLRLSPPGFGQILAEAALEMDDAYLDEVREEYDRRRKTVFNRLRKMPGVISYLPGGAFYCFTRLPIDDAEIFCRWLLESFEYQGATLMISPGQGFYATPGLGQQEVRLAFVLNTADLEKAMDCLENALATYPGRKEAEIKAAKAGATTL
ncbi:MAG TPA: pyridoxal phosphate-dependent aminotransferase [Flavilitoribacter sp.]|nr:pyridoxal phosphate-dependent aminotransferase [Flavilitoribacter sp.]